MAKTLLQVFSMSIELVCFWLFSPVYYFSISEEVVLKEKIWYSVKRFCMKNLYKLILKNSLSEEEFDIVGNLTTRNSRVIDLIINKLFRSIDAVEPEDSGTLIINRAEKRELINSSDRLKELKDLRNEIVHEYETDDLLDTFEQVRNNIPEVLIIAKDIKSYYSRQNYIKLYYFNTKPAAYNGII